MRSLDPLTLKFFEPISSDELEFFASLDIFFRVVLESNFAADSTYAIDWVDNESDESHPQKHSIITKYNSLETFFIALSLAK